MAKIQDPLKNGKCKSCQFSTRGSSDLLCRAHSSIRIVACKTCKICFCFKERSGQN